MTGQKPQAETKPQGEVQTKAQGAGATIITSLDGYLSWLKKIRSETPWTKSAYRGVGWGEDTIEKFKNLPKCLWNGKGYEEKYNLLQMQKDLLAEFRMAGHSKDKKPDLELLADIQHVEPRTCFIDYSLNPLVALYFACLDDKTNGLVIANDIDAEYFRNVTIDDIDKKIDDFFIEKAKVADNIVSPEYQSNKKYSLVKALPWVWQLPTADHPPPTHDSATGDSVVWS